MKELNLKKRKYQITLSGEYGGDVIVEARTKKEAEEEGEKILNEGTPFWFEYGGEMV